MRAFRRTVGLVVGYVMIVGGLGVAVPAAFFVLLGLANGGVSSQLLAVLAGGLALIALGLVEVHLTDRQKPAQD
jgi:nitrate/nitrite transporter NarK